MNNKIKNFKEYTVNKYEDMFQYLYDHANNELKNIIDESKEINQSKNWHSEGNVYTHIKLVTNRLHNTYHDINLIIAGLFHDLGKNYVTEYNEDEDKYSAHGHEFVSVDILDDFYGWVKSFNTDVNLIEYIIKNHMRIKFLDEFRLEQKINFFSDPKLEYLLKFNSADYGGFGNYCKPIKDLTKIKKEIEEAKKYKNDTILINSKINGNILMSIYPELKGFSLGKTIKDFKELYDDFRTFALNNTKDDILKEFDNFYKEKKS